MRGLCVIILWLVSVTVGTAQNLIIYPVNTESELSLLVKNPFPCPITLSAFSAKMDTLKAYIPAGKQQIILREYNPAENLIDELTETLKYNFILGDPDAVHDNDYRYSLPFPKGKAYMLTQGNKTDFSHNDKISHYAFDFAMPEGSYVSAARGGVVGYVQENFTEGGDDIKLIHQGNYIMVCHNDGSLAAYAHLQHNGALVEVGDPVFAGQVIGLSGNTGFTTSPHLHFSVLIADRSIPIRFQNEYTILYEGEIYQHN